MKNTDCNPKNNNDDKKSETKDADKERFVNTEEAARITGLAKSTLQNRRNKGKKPDYHKVGRRVLYSEKTLMQFMAQRKVETNLE
jgi:hypothetical protein